MGRVMESRSELEADGGGIRRQEAKGGAGLDLELASLQVQTAH